MQIITVDKTRLLKELRDNRSKHRTVFEAAIAGFRTESVKQLEDMIYRLKNGLVQDVYISTPAPADHTRDYDRVIRMVEMNIGDTFQLSESDFGSYVMDDWAWKRQFVNTSSTYAAATVTQVYGADAINDDN